MNGLYMTDNQMPYECKNCGEPISESSGLCESCAFGFENLQVIAAKRLRAGNSPWDVVNQLVARAEIPRVVAEEIVNLSQSILSSDEFSAHAQDRSPDRVGRSYVNREIVWGLVCIGVGTILSFETNFVFVGAIIYGIYKVYRGLFRLAE